MPKVIIDVREPAEFATGHVNGAVNVPPSQLLAGSKLLKGVSKDTEIILYCRSGNRSNVAKNILNQLGFTNVTNGINKGHVEASLLLDRQ